jgi:hypothetical protein
MELPAILKEENVEAAAELLRRYYLEPSTKTGLLSTCSYSDEWANCGDNPDVKDKITDSDAVAVSMLSVKVPAQAVIGLQKKPLAARIEKLLAKIPTDVKMSRGDFLDPLGHPLAPFFDERQHVLPVFDVLRRCGRCSGTLEFVWLQEVRDFLVVGAGRYEVSKVEELHEPLEPLLPLPEEFEKVLVGGGGIGEGAV